MTPSAVPDAATAAFRPFVVTAPGRTAIISDIHAPYHDPATLALFAALCRDRKVKTVIVNGDTLDGHGLSTHDKDADALRFAEEVRIGRELFQWLRRRLPNARIIVKEGNHEERLARYVLRAAPALEGLPGLHVRELLDLDNVGAEWVGERRPIAIGRLDVLHGHEFAGGGGVYPARWLWLRTRGRVMCGHFHRTSEYHDADVRGRPEAAWSLGCACYLRPPYRRFNAWNHGFAFVDVDPSGEFRVENLRVRGGRIE